MEAHDKYSAPSTWAENKNRDRITLVCTSVNPDKELINKMLRSAIDFDTTVLHFDTSKIVKWYSKQKETKEEWIMPGHFSIPDAYNLLISDYVEDEWICCFCDDDYFYPEGLTNMLYEIHSGNARDCDVAHFKFHVSGYAPPEDKRCWFGIKEYDLCEKKPITPKLLGQHGRMPAGSFFRKSALAKVGGFQGKFEHDRNLWLRMAQAGCTFKYFDHLVYNFVRRPNSAWIRQYDST